MLLSSWVRKVCYFPLGEGNFSGAMLNFVGVSSSRRAILQDCMCPLSSLHWSPLLVSNGGACTTLPEKKKTCIPINLWTTKKHVYIKAPSKQKLVACKNSAASPQTEVTWLCSSYPAANTQRKCVDSPSPAWYSQRRWSSWHGVKCVEHGDYAWHVQMDMHNMCVCVCAMVCAHIPVEDIQVWCTNIIYTVYILRIFFSSI